MLKTLKFQGGLGMSTSELNKLAKELKELEVMADELDAEIEDIKDKIKAEMDSRNVQEVNAGMFKIKYQLITSERFDSKRFREENEELYKSYQKKVITRRFTIN